MKLRNRDGFREQVRGTGIDLGNRNGCGEQGQAQGWIWGAGMGLGNRNGFGQAQR